MKRRVCLTLCGAALALALAACGGANPPAGTESQPSLVSSQAESAQQESAQQATPQPRQAEPSQGESASSAAEGASLGNTFFAHALPGTAAMHH